MYKNTILSCLRHMSLKNYRKPSEICHLSDVNEKAKSKHYWVTGL